MTTSQKYDAMTAMATFGGSFARRLADAWHFADSDNRAKIEAAFPEMIANYAAMAEATDTTNEP